MANTVDHKIHIILLIIFISTFIKISLTADLEDGSRRNTLKLVTIMHRHGIRAPQMTWPTDPFKDEKKYWPNGFGQLLTKGKQQLYQVGKTLRRRYKKFIHRYSPYTVRVNTSDYDRCHMSVDMLLAAWFPPEPDQMWSKKLAWQPIPVHSKPINEDHVISLEAPCPRYKLEYNKYLKEAKSNMTGEVKKLYKFLSKHMGESVDNIQSKIIYYYTTLVIQKRLGYKLPSWTNYIFPLKAKNLAREAYGIWVWSNYMKKIRGGGMIKEILNQFKMKISGQSKKRKLLIYSSHDTTIAGVWGALGLNIGDIFPPDFASVLLFELHKLKKTFYVKMYYYNDSMTTEPNDVTIPGCSNPCSFKRLYKITEYMRSVDYERDCKL